MKILLAVDGSDCSVAAVAAVARRPWPAGSEVKLLAAIEPLFVPTSEAWAVPANYYAQLEKAGQDQAHEAIDKAVEQFRARRDTPLEVSTEAMRGQAKDVILDRAEHWGADLIVVGSHGYRGFKRFLLGSVSQAVAAHAKCSVEIVRCRQSGQSEDQ